MKIKIKVYAGGLGLISEKILNPGDIVTLHGIVYRFEEILDKNDEIVSMANFCGHSVSIEQIN